MDVDCVELLTLWTVELTVWLFVPNGSSLQLDGVCIVLATKYYYSLVPSCRVRIVVGAWGLAPAMDGF
jgi:hypothetical protein